MKKNSKFCAIVANSSVLGLGVVFAWGCLPPSGVAVKSNSMLSVNQAQTGGTPADDGNFQVVPANAAFSVTGALNAAINLGAKSDQTYTLHTGNYSGTIRLSVEYDEVKEIDKKSQISISIPNPVINVAPNSNYNFMVHVESTQAAPDLALHYHVLAREASGSIRKESQLETEFAVRPIFEIMINAGNALNTVLWSTDLVNAGTGVAAKQQASFIAHTGGVTLRFINMDPKGPHIIHGSGVLAHQNTATRLRSLATGAVNPAGLTYIDAYEMKIMSTAANATASYYLHDGESAAKAGRVVFNQDAASVKPPVVDATATFAKMNAMILQSKCVSCHNAGNPAGGVDLSTHAKTLGSVIPFDAASSALYTSVLSNMPLGGMALTTVERDLIKNWINNGALNN